MRLGPESDRAKRQLMRLGASAAVVGMLLAAGIGATSRAQAPSLDEGASTLRVAVIEGGLVTLVGDYVADPATFNAGRLWRCCLARTLMAYPGLPTLEGGTILHPDLAAGAPTISPDGLSWSFRIRPGVRYQPPFDTRSVIADDIVRAIERSVRVSPEMVEPGGPWHRLVGAAAFAAGDASVISGLQSPDAMSLTFRLTSPDGAFGHYLTDASSAPIPAGVSDGFDPVPREPDPSAGVPPGTRDTPFGAHFVSSGAYMFESYPADTSGGRATLVRNPAWDASTDPLRRPVPGRIEIVTLPDAAAAYAALERGEVDIVDQLADASVVARYKRDPGLAARLLEGSTETITFVPMNLAQPPFDDVAVRRAANAVMDRTALMEAHLEGRSGLPWLSGFRGTGEVATHVFADHLTAGLLVTYDPFPSSGGRGDPVAAHEEMRRSRYDTDGDGRCDAAACTGVRIVADFPAMGEVIRTGLDALGIEGQVVALSDEVDMSNAANRTAIQANWWQWGYGLHGDLVDLLRGRDALRDGRGLSNQSLVGATPEQLAAWGYERTDVPALDDLIDACELEVGHRRASCWARLDQLVSDVLVPWIPVSRQTAAWVVSPRVVSVSLDQSAFGVFPALERTVVASDP